MMLVSTAATSEAFRRVTAVFILLAAVALLSGVVVADPDFNTKSRETTPATKSQPWTTLVDPPRKTMLNMTLCTGKCSGDCKSYITPLSECYSSGDLFPNDPSWSGLDVFDTAICQTLVRRIFQTSNSSCRESDADDHFQIPLEECVGPFGQPRPWGTFSLVRGNAAEETSTEAQDC